MTRLGVGRSTVREVVNGLAILGALEIRHGQGAFVLDPEVALGAPHRIAAALARGVTGDLFEAAQLVEAHTARLAAERRTKHDLTEIARILEQHERAVAARTTAVEATIGFHVRLGWAARNEMLAQTVDCIAELLRGSGPAREAMSGYREWELAEHRSILIAVVSADPDRAASRMSAHLDGVRTWHDRLPPIPRVRPRSAPRDSDG